MLITNKNDQNHGYNEQINCDSNNFSDIFKVIITF
jgi:hypothetical protein